jgi:hypothetical protein
LASTYISALALTAASRVRRMKRAIMANRKKA